MFSNHLLPSIESLRSLDPIPSEQSVSEVSHAASNSGILGDLIYASTLGADAVLDAEILRISEAAKARIFHNRLFAIAPIYVTSFCQERCLYCNYRAENRGVEVQRLRLSPKQLRMEFEFLVEKGIRVLELVYGTDPNVRIDTICQHVEIAREVLDQVGGGSIGINAEPFDVEDYDILVSTGLDFAVLWQETYDPARYRELHPGRTKKADMAYRLDGPERMIQGGLKTFGMGVLSGLFDWRFDWAMLVRHGDYLRERYGIGPSILGVPRLKPARGALIQKTQWTPTDHEFQVLLACHNLFRPDILPFINTRESWDMCVSLARGGGALFTFDCSTIPGGYSLGSTGYQFPTGSYDANAYVPLVEKAGFEVDFEWMKQMPRTKASSPVVLASPNISVLQDIATSCCV